ncbi:T9SS C-terminal target domain-containing protein [Dokdonia sinensis]|uniref:T9SS C-terminal target domain-containing protein n=1 Tax=Dokdonia sinensis TaxID=2479847 RepID=A0A3M0GA52_9FLAO|nr:T9SS type A sorting domain-containing protein [Dokdonia sinensis]RMB58523.1 T9SS C-terminal target domain-containing protein [Dokdonia sinensis]
MKKITLLLALLVASFSYGQIVINEVDADQTGTDETEFIELLSDTGNFSLDGYIVVLFNGGQASNTNYRTIDLQGQTTDANGYFIIGGDLVSGADITLGADNVIQNGPDAVAIYQASASDFPEDAPVPPTTTNLIDALVYGTNDADDAGLLSDLGESIQYDEDANNAKDTESLQRRDDGTFCAALPTLRAENACSACTLTFAFESAVCDAETTGTDTVTYTISFSGGGQETITLTSDVGGTISGDDPSTAATGTITIVTDEDTDSMLTATGATCDVSIELFGEACAPTEDVTTIADLRAGTIGLEYVLTSEALLTYQQDFRNQKFIEDDTAAILIDDNDGVITSVYTIGDRIAGIQGTLSEFQGMLQFVPTQDPGGAVSSNNAVDAQDVTAAQLNANPNDYESEYVRILAATIDNTNSATWENGEEYALTTAAGDFTFRTSFFNVDYIGTDVPTDPSNISGIITERNNGDYFITARNAADIDSNLSIAESNIVGLSVYPNPATDVLTISTALNAEKAVVVFDITGKKVIDTKTSGVLNVNNLQAGVYIMQITEGEATATAKLVIK